MIEPATQRIRERPTEPERERTVEGVANMPVPIMRLKIRKIALVRPISRRKLTEPAYICASPSLTLVFSHFHVSINVKFGFWQKGDFKVLELGYHVINSPDSIFFGGIVGTYVFPTTDP